MKWALKLFLSRSLTLSLLGCSRVVNQQSVNIDYDLTILRRWDEEGYGEVHEPFVPSHKVLGMTGMVAARGHYENSHWGKNFERIAFFGHGCSWQQGQSPFVEWYDSYLNRSTNATPSAFWATSICGLAGCWSYPVHWATSYTRVKNSLPVRPPCVWLALSPRANNKYKTEALSSQDRPPSPSG